MQTITAIKHANSLGFNGYDRQARTHYTTQDLAGRGIAVRIDAIRKPSRYMIVTGTSNHQSAYEIALQLAPAIND